MKSLDRLLFMDGSVSLNIFVEDKKKNIAMWFKSFAKWDALHNQSTLDRKHES